MFTIDNGIVDLYFSSISGGKTYLFGKIPISESNVEKAKRLKIMCKEEIYEFEINEILKWDKVDDVFIAPKLCD